MLLHYHTYARRAYSLDFLLVVIAWDFAEMFFSAFVNNPKGTYNNGNLYHCTHLPHAGYFYSRSLYLDSFSDTLMEVFLLSDVIIWFCLTRTGNYKIHEFDWLKSILTAV